MGIFNEHSSNHYQFAKGVQGAPGVGFNLTADGNYDMVGKKLTNVGNPTSDTDSATKKYVDTHSGGGKTSLITVDSNIDMKDTYRILNLKSPSDADEPVTKNYAESNFFQRDGSQQMTGDVNMNNKKIKNLSSPTANSDAATKKYVDDSKVDGSVFLKLDGTRQMTGDLNMNNKQIFNIPNPTGSKQPIPLAYGDLAYLHVDGSNMMTNHMNMNNKKITHLQTPTNNTDAATKKYVDDKSKPQDLSPFFKKDGSAPMTGNLNINGNKIINLEDPASDNDAVNKKYVDDHLHQSQVQPSHYKDEFAFLMSSPSQWTDEIDTRTSFIPKKIADLTPNKGNFHDYNHKVLYMNILKNFQGGYKYKMGLNFYRLVGGADYTLCLEILNIDYQLWHKTQISVDDNSSQGLQLGNVSVKKLQHSFIDSLNKTQFMYYHRVIINFKKLTTGNKFFIHILVNIPNNGNDLSVYPIQFSGVFIIAYGIMSKVSNIDPDKVYDHHTAFDIQKTQVKYNVDINANNKKILNIALDKTKNNSAATVGMVNGILPFTKNNVYREYFEKYFDFTDVNNYGLTKAVYGIVITSFHDHVTIANKNIGDIKKNGLDISGTPVNFFPFSNFTDYTLCIVFSHLENKNFSLNKININNSQKLLKIFYDKSSKRVSLNINNKSQSFMMPNNFNGKYIILWLTEKYNPNVTKIKISNYGSILSLPSTNNADSLKFEFTVESGVLSRMMFSPNFYDFDSEQFHRSMIQEKINGTYII